MNLYRLDYIDANEKITGAVQGWHINLFTNSRDVLTRHMTTARTHALDAARRAECDVLVSRIGGKSASVRGVLIVRPDGTARKPPGAKGEDCTAGPNRPPCFCRNCRAGRRA